VTIIDCTRCSGAGWICEAHQDRPWPHDECCEPGEPCFACNTGNPPRRPPGFISLASVDD
jgi:hypothetical protein